MQVLKKYVFIFLGLLLSGCQSTSTTSSPRISGYDQRFNDLDFNSPSISLIGNLPQEEDNNFRVGMLLPLSGKAEKYGQGLKNAALMALDDVKTDNLILQFYDTRSTSSGARIAIENALAQNSKLILGPLMSSSVQAIEETTTSRDVPVIAFSTNTSVLQPQVYTLGLLVDEQVERIVGYAARQGRKRLALLLPDNDSGITIAKAAIAAAQKNNITVSKIAFYPPETTDFSASVKALTDYDERSARLARVRSSLKKQANAGNVNAEKALKRLERIQALGDVDFDAVLIPESGVRLKSALAMFGYYDVYSPKVRFLGTAIWDTTDMSRETMAHGSWYPALSKSHGAYFASKYNDVFGEKPASIYSLAYDAVALSAALARKQTTDLNPVITSPEGYIGINGVFRLFEDGYNQHSLDIVELGSDGEKVVDEAPKNFSGNLHGHTQNNIVIDEFYQAPVIYGKNPEAVQIAVYGQVLDYANQPKETSPQDEMEIIRKSLKELNVVIPQ